MPTVAVLGVGRMGGAMARRFADAGYPVVVWNRDRAKADAVAAETGADIAESPAEAASSSDILVSSLADDEALRMVYLGPDGVAEGGSQSLAAADTSTVAPLTVVEVGAAMDRTGAGFADCPVSGSISTVETGSLIVMAGGDPEVVDRVEPVLGAIARQVVRVGGRGAGAACKLAVNGLVHGLNIALSEALVLAEKAGVDRKAAYEVFAAGAGGAPFVQYKREAFENPDDAKVAFTLDLVAKDLELITGLAEQVGAPMAQAGTGLEIVGKALAKGMAERDMSAIAVYLRDEGA
ncbi:MAG TPA: NAD(P)-dependent oxidoreductase [Acidimicrobiia bacterium]|nr:NAD(P)-dependent oxidoreductase [Acidimicrobiia bacterium]